MKRRTFHDGRPYATRSAAVEPPPRRRQNRNRPAGKSGAAMLEQRLSPVLRPLFKIFRVSNLEDLIKRLLKLAFTLVLLIPLFLLPLYFFFFTLLHL
jgi:hypothetical protein